MVRLSSLFISMQVLLSFNLFYLNSHDYFNPQVQPQTVTLTQATAAGPQQVQVIPAGTAAAHVVQQKLLQHQVMAATASQQLQVSSGQTTASVSSTTEAQSQQAKLQVRTQTVRIKAPTKPS